MTQWLPDTEIKRKIWLLEDGRLIEEPELEISGSGRKVRIRGRQDTSVYLKDRDIIIQHAVDDAVRKHGGEILTCIRRSQAIEEEDPTLPEVEFVFDEGIQPIRCIWTFRHESLPLTARITLSLSKHGFRRSNYEVEAKLEFDEISPRSRHAPLKGYLSREEWSSDIPGPRWSDVATTCKNALADSGLNPHFRNQAYTNEREAIRAFNEQLDVFMSWDKVVIPDLRKTPNEPSKVGWITLDSHTSNVDGELLVAIADYLDSEPLVEQIAEKYNELHQLLRQLGIVAEGRSPEDFQAAISSGEEALRVTLEATDPEGDRDISHTVYLHLLTGTLSVDCDASIDGEEAADAWRLARFEAEMQGELDSFLEFYRSQAHERNRHQLVSTIEKRSN